MMRTTEGEGSKAKTTIKAIPTKAKTKKSKGGNSTKKKSRKKKSSATRKKIIDSKKINQRKKRNADEEQAQQPLNKDPTKNRRSDRNRNNSFNYEESSHQSSAPSEDEISCENETTTRSRRRRETVAKRDSGRTKETTNNEVTEENWEIYDQGIIESDASWNDHYRRLQEFHSTHGHSGVPIHWSAEPDFADWVSRQRQIFREIHSGYRVASPREEGRWKQLQVLRFPLNYKKWLWQRKYNELCEALNGGKYTDDGTLPSPLRKWVDHQKYLVGNGVYDRIDPELTSYLQKLGVLAGDNDSNDEIHGDK